MRKKVRGEVIFRKFAEIELCSCFQGRIVYVFKQTSHVPASSVLQCPDQAVLGPIQLSVSVPYKLEYWQ